MRNFLLLSGITYLFLLLSILESSLNKNISLEKNLAVKIPIKPLFVFLIIGVFGALFFVLLGPKNFVLWYLWFSLGMLVFGHAIWLTLQKNSLLKIIAFIITTGIVYIRFSFPSELTQNLFIFASVLWLGSFFTRLKLLTKNRFLIISIFWFFYDIGFVWLTHAAAGVEKATHVVGIPLALVVNNSSIGTGDLLSANLFLAVLSTKKEKIIASLALIVSDLLLGYYSYNIHPVNLFPLLVLWAPIGVFVLLVLSNSSKTHGGSK